MWFFKIWYLNWLQIRIKAMKTFFYGMETTSTYKVHGLHINSKEFQNNIEEHKRSPCIIEIVVILLLLALSCVDTVIFPYMVFFEFQIVKWLTAHREYVDSVK